MLAVIHGFNPSTQADFCAFQNSQGYTEKPCLEKTKKKKKNKKTEYGKESH